MGTKWYNKDGLTVRFGPRALRDDEDVASQTSTMGAVQELVLDLADLSTLPLNDATGVAAGEHVNAAIIPDGAFIVSGELVVDTLAAGATADLLVGAYTRDTATGQLTLVDADGFANATDGDVAGLTAGARIPLTGALINAAVAGDTVVAAAYATAAFTAGAVRVRIEYRV